MTPDANPYASLPGSGYEPAPSVDPALAGRFRRFAATMLDTAVTGAACFLALVAVFAFEDLTGIKLSAHLDAIAGVVFLVVIGALHVPFLVAGRTPGKKLFALRIVRTDGSPASPARLILLRHAAHLIAYGAMVLFFAAQGRREETEILPGFLLLVPFIIPMGWLLILRRDRRTLFDLIADTKVVRD